MRCLIGVLREQEPGASGGGVPSGPDRRPAAPSVRLEPTGRTRPSRPWAVDRRLQAAGDVLGHRLSIKTELTSDGGDLQALPVKFPVLMAR